MPTQRLTTADLHWVAGFLDGEGSFGSTRGMPLVSASQKDRFALEKLQRIFKRGTIGVKHNNGRTTNDLYYWQISSRAAAAIMMTIYSLMSPYRQRQIKVALEKWKQLGATNKHWRGGLAKYRSYYRGNELIWDG